ncbi:dystroglycan [Lycorma delicatula]|uniref:dystroglycan n=1 Tax=Lycorma delicatula TaxID=130591 RepID=UPI003F50FE98
MALFVLTNKFFIPFLLTLVIISAHNEEDFGFEQDEQDMKDTDTDKLIKIIPLQRLYGIPDSSAYVGRLFQFKVPSDAFTGTLSHYEVSDLPDWLIYDDENGQAVFEGVPGDRDVGESYISVTAVGPNTDDTVKDVFAVEVSPDPREFSSDINEPRCKPGQDATTLTVVLDKDFYTVGSIDRISSVKNIAGFLALDSDKFSLLPQTGDDDLLSETVMMAGPGNRKKKISKSSTILQWQVGCGGSLWSRSNSVSRIKQIARDGTLAEVLQLPVLGWYLATTPFPFRERRQVVGSGEGEGEGENEAEEGTDMEPEPDKRVVVPMVSPSPSPVMPEQSPTVESHRVRHHGHHHREHTDSYLPSSQLASLISSSSALPPIGIMPTPTLSPERPTSSVVIVEEDHEHDSYPSSSHVLVPEVTRSYTLESSILPDLISPATDSTQATEPIDHETTVGLESSTEHIFSTYNDSTPSPTPNLSQQITTVETTTKEIEIEEPKNSPPVIAHRPPKLVVTAGKILRYTIPDNTFNDTEDGSTRRLHIAFKTHEGNPIAPYSWVQFNSYTLEIYCLPLEEHVSKWYFIIEATDSEGDFVSDELEIKVQHHKAHRTVTHEITLHLQPSDHSPVQGYLPLDQQMLIVNRLSSIYNDPDSSQITVIGVNSTSFSWTNDSLSRIYCPRNEVINLVKVLAEDDGRPKQSIKEIFLPEIDVVKVTWQGKGQCEEGKAPPPKLKNYPPIPRNQVDRLNATVGELLVYAVPEDSFYDPEDGSVRNLKLTLLNVDLSPIDSAHWLQFDVKNQEFYGIPPVNASKRKEYQLVCEDNGGLTFTDVLEVIVYPATKRPYNVEFSMTLSMPFEKFVNSPASQRYFIEKLAELFGDKNTSAIVLSGKAPGSTIVTWHNRTLPTDYCPNSEIKPLRQILLGDDERVSVRTKAIMGPEFEVLAASVTPTGLCEGVLTLTYIPPETIPLPNDEIRPVSHPEEYLITVVVPAVVIATMLICAGLVACILYRRRRTGKMSVGDEDERQSFRSKGIPVIFQDELEERPEPTNKSPIIMKEEKPPLPPPEYQRSHPSPATALLSDTEDSPYQPPPPFTTSRDTSRPKPTPTYRMPPPYVPP